MGGRSGNLSGSHGIQKAVAAQQSQKQTQQQAQPKPQQKKASTATPNFVGTAREKQLLTQIRNDPGSLMLMKDADAAAAVKAIEKQPIATDGTQQDTFAQRYLNVLGWSDNKPQVLDDAAYESARKAAGEESMYHAVSNNTQSRDQYLYGETEYISGGFFGGGTYWAYDDAGESAGYGQYQIKSFLNSNSRAVDLSTLDQRVKSLKTYNPKLYRAIRNTNSSYCSDESMRTLIAASYGYNTILCGNGKGSGDYIVTLNRSATTVSKKTTSSAGTRMQNW